MLFSLPKAVRSCVPPAAMEPSASCAAPARMGEFVTTSPGSAPVLLDGWWVLLLLTQALHLHLHWSLSQPGSNTPQTGTPCAGCAQHLHTRATTLGPATFPGSVPKTCGCGTRGQGLVGSGVQGEWLDLITLEDFSSRGDSVILWLVGAITEFKNDSEPRDKRVVCEFQLLGIFPAALDSAPTQDRKLKAQLSLVRGTECPVPLQGRGSSQEESWLRQGAELSPGHRVQLSVCPCSGTTAIDCQRFVCVRAWTAERQLP